MKLLFLVLVFSFPLFAQDFAFDKESGQAVPNFIAQIKIARGKVFKSTAGKKNAVKVGTRLYKDDTLITEANSFAQILVVDDTVMTLGAKSELNFADFKFVDKTDRQIVYSFIKGQIRGIIKNKAKEGDLTVKTKLATMGVRGTELMVNHQTLNNLEISEFALLHGNVVVTDDKNQTHELSQDDRMIIVQDSVSKDSANEKNKLAEDELKALKNKDNFMNYFEPSYVNKNSSLFSFFHDDDASKVNAESNATPTVGDDKDKNWRTNLRKLNQKLKEYQTPSH